MKNFLKGMLFSVVSVILFIAVILFSFDIRDKKYFKDVGTVAEQKEAYNFFYGVFGYHTRTPIYSKSTNEFDLFMYEIVTTKESDTNEMLEYIYMLYIPKVEVRKNTKDKYLRYYLEDGDYLSVSLYQYMDFNMYNTYDENFLINVEFFEKLDRENVVTMTIEEETRDSDGNQEEVEIIFSEDYINPTNSFDIKNRLEIYFDQYEKLPNKELIDNPDLIAGERIYPRITHIAEGYSYIVWLGFGAGIFVILALFGGVYLKPPFQKGDKTRSPGMEKDKEKYV